MKNIFTIFHLVEHNEISSKTIVVIENNSDATI